MKRTKAQEPAQQGSPAGTVEIPPPPGSSLFKQRWAELIKKVYEADPDPMPPWEWRRGKKSARDYREPRSQAPHTKVGIGSTLTEVYAA